MAIPFAERIRELYRRLESDPPTDAVEEALILICRRLDEVEDEMSGIPKADPPPARGESDGRMYAPQADSIQPTADGGLVCRTRGHQIRINADGSFEIENMTTGQVEFRKAGAGHE